ncbi:MAG TPA: hypothetical protein VIV06_06095, partial [Candidatus Limnocylindrales bacterium]
MPQSGWLAIGAACVAWLAGSHGVAAGWLFASVGVFIAIALAMAGSTGGPGSPRGRSLANARSTAVCAVGASAIALRLLFVATPPPSDVPDGR